MTDLPIKRDLTAGEVASFLRRHPEFLSEYPDLALALTLPRTQGPSTSLASYQLEVLRDKNRSLNRRLHELIAIASENEQLMVRVHAFTLSLMRARSAAESLERVVATLNEDLHTDLVRVVLSRAVAQVPEANWLKVALEGDAQLPRLRDVLGRGEPVCGRLDADQLGFLFGDRAADVRSAVLVPIPQSGLIAVGSLDANRFHPGMGTVFLKLIGDAVAAALARFDLG